MKKKIPLFPSFAVFALCCAGVLPAEAQSVIPVPAEMKLTEGAFAVAPGVAVFCNLQGVERERLAAYATSQPLLRACAGTDDASAAGILLLKTETASPDSPEGYALSVSPERIRIEARTDAGLFYGLQTLLQLAEPAADGNAWTVPACVVSDSPRFPYRGFMMDVSRHFRSKEFVKKQMDAMARFKLNRLHLHLTDGAGWRVEIKKYPRLTEFAAWRPEAVWKDWWFKENGRRYCEVGTPGAYGGFYTQDDIRELLAYAAERHITVVPEIEMPAHSEEVLAAYPELSCSGKPYGSAEFCIGNEKTFAFLENVLEEILALFPSEYIHIGGDEANKETWKRCPKCRERMAAEGLENVDELQSYAVRRMDAFLSARGRKLLGWDEIMQGGLAPGAAVMSWRGEEGGRKAVRAGHRAVMTPAEYFYFDYYQDAPLSQPEAIGGYVPLEKVYSYDPVKADFSPEEAALIYGVQANQWAEYITSDAHYEYMMYPRLLALAEVAWSAPERKAYPDFRSRALRAVERLKAAGYNPFPLKDEIGRRPESRSPIAHLALNKPVRYNAPFSEAYGAGGEKALTDGLRGDWTYADGRWQGFISRERLDAVVDLGEETRIGGIAVDFMQAAGPEVFLPAEVVISVSSDGVGFTELKRAAREVSREPAFAFDRCSWTGETLARYVRVRAKAGKKYGGWIFTDEIVVLPPNSRD